MFSVPVPPHQHKGYRSVEAGKHEASSERQDSPCHVDREHQCGLEGPHHDHPHSRGHSGDERQVVQHLEYLVVEVVTDVAKPNHHNAEHCGGVGEDKWVGRVGEKWVGQVGEKWVGQVGEKWVGQVGRISG